MDSPQSTKCPSIQTPGLGKQGDCRCLISSVSWVLQSPARRCAGVPTWHVAKPPPSQVTWALRLPGQQLVNHTVPGVMRRFPHSWERRRFGRFRITHARIGSQDQITGPNVPFLTSSCFLSPVTINPPTRSPSTSVPVSRYMSGFQQKNDKASQRMRGTTVRRDNTGIRVRQM